MKVYLLRHGDSTEGLDDDARPLSLLGENQIGGLAKHLHTLNLAIPYVLHSPKLRAKQTAEIIARSVSSENTMSQRKELNPMADVDLIIEEIEAYDNDMLIVGHLPYLAKLTTKLLTGHMSKNIVNFNTGSIVCLEKVSAGQWVIDWMLNPNIIQ